MLSDAYSFDSPTVYSVQLDTQVLYSKSLPAASLSQPLSSNTRHFFLANTDKPAKLTKPQLLRQREKSHSKTQEASAQGEILIPPSFSGNWPFFDKIYTDLAFDITYDTLRASAIAVDNDSHYCEWFGTASAARLKYIMDVYFNIWLELGY